MNEPLVTVGLQFFNNEATLAQAVQSILNQSYARWELILHDDGSNDRSVDIASRFRDPRIRLFHDGARKRRASRLNESLRQAQGKYYALADADDVSYPNRLAKQVEYLDAHPSVDLLGANMMVFDDIGSPLGKRRAPQTHQEICRRPWSGFPMAQPTFMGRTEWFQTHRYNEAMPRVEDQDLLVRTYRISRFANLPDILVGYRESRLSADKLMAERRLLTRALVQEFLLQRRIDLVVRSASEQIVKAAVDFTAINTRLGYRLLRHRALPISELERQEWMAVWKQVGYVVLYE